MISLLIACKHSQASSNSTRVPQEYALAMRSSMLTCSLSLASRNTRCRKADTHTMHSHTLLYLTRIVIAHASDMVPILRQNLKIMRQPPHEPSVLLIPKHLCICIHNIHLERSTSASLAPFFPPETPSFTKSIHMRANTVRNTYACTNATTLG